MFNSVVVRACVLWARTASQDLLENCKCRQIGALGDDGDMTPFEKDGSLVCLAELKQFRMAV